MSDQSLRPIRISSLKVNGFKSLHGFRLSLAKFSCLVGLNGSGKSTVLQFFDFVAQLMRGDVEGWLEARRWKPLDVRFKVPGIPNVDFELWFVDADGLPVGSWIATYAPRKLKCIAEKICAAGCELKATENEIVVRTSAPGRTKSKPTVAENLIPVSFRFQGSVLAALKEDLLPPAFLPIKRFFEQTESLDMLTPERLRQRTRTADGSLGQGGRNLSAFVHELRPSERSALGNLLKSVYPRFAELRSKSLRSGWKQLQAIENFADRRWVVDSQHLNDGLLRLVAILSEIRSSHPFVLLDEIENGINPELVEFVIEQLVQTPQQVLVTTHSPLILNYLDDETAIRGVHYLYRTTTGAARAIPLFAIPSLRKKLEVMGPGEAFVDTDLTRLEKEIRRLPKESS